MSDNEAYIVLSDDYPYFDEIESAMKIRKFVKSRNVSQLPASIQSIISTKQKQASSYEANARNLIAKSIMNATFVVCGEVIAPKGSTVQEKMNEMLSYLTESVYRKLDFIRYNYNSDDEVFGIIKSAQSGLVKTASANEEAVREIAGFLKDQMDRFLPTSVKDIQERFGKAPYGWREIDIAACLAELIASQDISLQQAGNTISPNERRIVDCMRKKTEIDKVLVIKKVKVSDKLLKDARDLMKDYLNVMSVPSKEDELVQFIIATFETKRDECEELLRNFNVKNYPGKNIVEKAKNLFKDILVVKRDNTSLLSTLLMNEDDLYDIDEDVNEVVSFFRSQRTVYDKGSVILEEYKHEIAFVSSDEVTKAYDTIKTILSMDKPYRRIAEIPEQIRIIESSCNEKLDEKRKTLKDAIEKVITELEQYRNEYNIKIFSKHRENLKDIENSLSMINKITVLDAKANSLYSIKERAIEELVKEGTPVSVPNPPKVVKKSSLLESRKITKADLDSYLDSIRTKLLQELEDSDTIHII